MTRKFAWWGACGLAATALFASGALAEAVRLTASDGDLGWQDVPSKVRPSPIYTTNEDPPPPPPPPKIKPKQGIGSGAESLSSPSDQPPKVPASPLEGPVPGAYGPLQKEGYGPIQNGYVGPLQKGGGGYYGDGCGAIGPSCEYSGPSCGVNAPSCGYDNASYGDCFTPSSCCCSRWAFRAEAIFWDRSNAAAQVIATAPGDTVNTGDFNFNAQAGPRLSLFYRNFLDSCWDLEMTYFGIHGWEEAQQLPGATSISTIPQINFAPNVVDSVYHSRLDSSEVNFRRQWTRWVTFLAGVRWIEEGEILNNNIGGIANHNVNVNNHLYGGQLGLDAILWNRGGPWIVEGIGKLGVYHINSDVTTTNVGIGGTLPLINASATDTAFTADLGVTAVYQMSSYANLRFGYNLFWIDGIADAPAQMTTTNIATGVASVEQNNTQFYHGASIGIEFRR